MQLFDSQHVRKLLSVHKLVRPNLLFSDVVRSNEQTCREFTTKGQVVSNHCRVFNQKRHANLKRGRIAKQCGNPIQNYTVANVNTKVCDKQCVSHMCETASNSIDQRIHVDYMLGNQFVHVNRFQPLYSSDIETCKNCHSVEVNTVVTDTEGKHACDTPVACGNGIKPVEKGKKENVIVVNNDKKLARGHDASHKRLQHTGSNHVVPPNSTTKVTSTNAARGVTNIHNVKNCLQDSDVDKYALEIQNSNKSLRIQEAKAAPGNKQCIEQNRPLFGFIPIYGLKSRVYDNSNNSVCTDIIELHKKLRADGRPNYLGLQIPVMSKLKYDKWAAYLDTYWDWQLPLLIKYGFPLDFDRNQAISSDLINHKSVLEYPEHVTTHLREEIENEVKFSK